jgi:hypothetical protein
MKMILFEIYKYLRPSHFRLMTKWAVVAILGSVVFVACDKQNIATPLSSLDRIDKSEEYYANLRAYKKSNHQKIFGWFAEWNTENASSGTSLRGVPDSVDIIAIWSGGHPTTKARKDDMAYVQKVKGTTVVFTVFLHYVGDGLSDHDKNALPTNKNEAIVKWANDLADTVYKYNYDGLDLDFEPDWCGCVAEMANKANFDLFVNTINKRLGPKSNSGKLLIIDGSMTGSQSRNAMKDMGDNFDYFLEQAYAATSYTALDNRFNQAIAFFPPEKILMNINFQNGEYDDPAAFTLRDGSKWDRFFGYAKWQPSNGMKKGGVGGYQIQIDFTNSPEYKYIRGAIQIMNPAIK